MFEHLDGQKIKVHVVQSFSIFGSHHLISYSHL